MSILVDPDFISSNFGSIRTLPDVSLENQHQTQPMPRTSLAASLEVSRARLQVEDKTRVAKDRCVTLTLRQLDM